MPTGGDLTFQAVQNDYFDYDSPSITKAQYLGTAGDVFGRSGREFAYLASVPVLPLTTPGDRLFEHQLQPVLQAGDQQPAGPPLRPEPATSRSATTPSCRRPTYEDKKGYGVSPEAYATSLTNYNAERLIIPGLFAPKGLQYGLSTINGIRARASPALLDIELGNNTLSVGAWFEEDVFHRTQQRYNQAGGSPDGDAAAERAGPPAAELRLDPQFEPVLRQGRRSRWLDGRP